MMLHHCHTGNTIPIMLTDYGKRSCPLVVQHARYAAGFGYTPYASQTQFRGATVATGKVELVPNSNGQQFYVNLPETAGDFKFGEIGFFDAQSCLVAIAVLQTPFKKYHKTHCSLGNEFSAVFELVPSGVAMPPDLPCPTPNPVPRPPCPDNMTNQHHHSHSHGHCHTEPEVCPPPPSPETALLSIDDTRTNTIPSKGKANPAIVRTPLTAEASALLAYDPTVGFTAIGWDKIAASGRITQGASNITFTTDTFLDNFIDQTKLTLPPLQYPGQMLVKIKNGPNRGTLRIVRSVTNDTITLYTPFETNITGSQDFEILCRDYRTPAVVTLTGTTLTIDGTPLDLVELAVVIAKDPVASEAITTAMSVFGD